MQDGEKKQRCCSVVFGTAEFLQNGLLAGLQQCREAASVRGIPSSSPLSSVRLLAAPGTLPDATAIPGCRREVQQGRSSCAGSCIFLNLKLGQKLKLESSGHDVHTSGKRSFKFTQGYFDTELCNILLCYIKTPVRDLNFVSLTILQRMH